MNELDLFTEALNRTDPAERAAFLDQACAGNPDLRRRLSELLAGHAQGGSPLDRPPVAPADPPTPAATGECPPGGATEMLAHTDLATTTDPDPDVSVPTALEAGEDRPDEATAAILCLDLDATAAEASAAHAPRAARSTTAEGIGIAVAGKYTLLEVIGEGGMGSVWRARQTEPVKRYVAVKLIKAGMDSKQVLARFDAERQALALMDHPNIAKVLDGGLHDGRPFFVMELVKGVPITEYCDRKRLTPTERLELFVHVCGAIQHAHQKGIIHRDIKPSNVLIALYDDKPVVKVIDFGVAKATGGTLTEHTIDTGFGGVVGTPQYMSPEQASFNNLDIDTRSDVYALGVLLYELLTGTPPFSKQDLEKRGILEMLRVVREEEPPRPSNKLSSSDALPTLSANRGTEPRRLTGLLRNDLDWIVMKALEKDRTRRYGTANGFAADVQRYLAGEAVLAHPPSTSYRIKKFVRRNKGQVIAASLVVLALLAGIGGTTWGLIRADRARQAEARERAKAVAERDAKETARAEAVKARQRADEERADAEAVKSFVTADLLGMTNHWGIVGDSEARGPDVTVRTLLDRAARRVGDQFAGRPLVEAGIRRALAGSYSSIGLGRESLSQQERAAELYRQVRGPNDPDTLVTMKDLAVGYYYGLGDPARAEPLVRQALDGFRLIHGPDAPSVIDATFHLSLIIGDLGRLEESERMMTENYHHSLRVLGPVAVPTAMTRLLTIGILLNHRDYPAAEREALEALALYRQRIGESHGVTHHAAWHLMEVYENTGRYDELERVAREWRDIARRVFGDQAEDTLRCTQFMAIADARRGRSAEAIPLLEQVYSAQVRNLGPTSPRAIEAARHLASCYVGHGRAADGIALLERLRDAQIDKLGPDHRQTLNTLAGLAETNRSAKRLDKSVPLLEDVLKRQEAKLGRQHPDTQWTVANLGINYLDFGRLKEAIPLLEEAQQSAKRFPAHRWVAKWLIDAYSKAGENDKAAELILEELPEARKALPKDSPQLADLLASIGMSLVQGKKWKEAEPLLRECLAIREKSQPDRWTTFNTKSMLGGALLGQKKYAEAEPLLRKGYEGMKQREKTIPPQGITRIPEALDRLTELATATNKPDDVKMWQAERAKYPDASPTPGEKKKRRP